MLLRGLLSSLETSTGRAGDGIGVVARSLLAVAKGLKEGRMGGGDDRRRRSMGVQRDVDDVPSGRGDSDRSVGQVLVLISMNRANETERWLLGGEGHILRGYRIAVQYRRSMSRRLNRRIFPRQFFLGQEDGKAIRGGITVITHGLVVALVVGGLAGDPALQLHDVGAGGLDDLVVGEVRVLPPVLGLDELRVDLGRQHRLHGGVGHGDQALLLVLELLPGGLTLLLGQVLVDLGKRFEVLKICSKWDDLRFLTWFSRRESWSWNFQMSFSCFLISSASRRSLGTLGIGLSD